MLGGAKYIGEGLKKKNFCENFDHFFFRFLSSNLGNWALYRINFITYFTAKICLDQANILVFTSLK